MSGCFILILFLLTALSAEADGTDPGVAAGSFRDLTESGVSLLFRDTGPGAVSVDIRGNPEKDHPAFDIRGRKGAAVSIAFPSLGAGWSARAWNGPGTWRPLTVRAAAIGIETRLVFRRDREVVELLPPPSHPTHRASDYTYSEYTAFMAGLPSDPRLTVSQIGLSVQNRPITRVIFDDTNSVMKPGMKPTAVFLIRQHGDEWPTSYVFEGMIDHLLGRNGRQPTARETGQMRWIFYTMVNPDGTCFDQRYNANGVDLNRDWGRIGPDPQQEPETLAVQTDLENLPWQDSIRLVGDHHGWWGSPDGGFRYDDGGPPASVPHAVYLESVKDTERYTLYEPNVSDWYENGGQDGMARVELFRWKGWVVHTVEYDRSTRDENLLRDQGAHCIAATCDTAYALSIPSGTIRLGMHVPLFVDEDDQNQDPHSMQTVDVTLFDWATKDIEVVTLLETGIDTGEFLPMTNIYTAPGVRKPFNGVLQTRIGSVVLALYTDPDLAFDSCFAGALIVP
jgi:hypothetical protein